VFKFFLLFVAPLQWVDCGCTCIEGVSKRTCQSAVQARPQAKISPFNARSHCEDCSVLPRLPLKRDYLDSPHEQAHNCPEARVWNKRLDEDYTGLRVCNVETS